MGISHNKQSAFTKYWEILKIFFVLLTLNLLPFLGTCFCSLLCFNFRSFACDFNLSTRNVGLCEKTTIYFIKGILNSKKWSCRMFLRITVMEFLEFCGQRLENLHRESKKWISSSSACVAKPRPILEDKNVIKFSYENKLKEMNTCVLRWNH